MERFTESELVHLIAYQNLYGPLGPERDDVLFARLGMDTVAPHMGRGKKPKFENHKIDWAANRKKRAQTPEEMLRVAKSITGSFPDKPKKEVTRDDTRRTDRRTRRRR